MVSYSVRGPSALGNETSAAVLAGRAASSWERAAERWHSRLRLGQLGQVSSRPGLLSVVLGRVCCPSGLESEVGAPV